MVFLAGFFDAVFGPLLKFHPSVLVLVVSVVMTLFVTIIQKFTTNQTEMKSLKEQQKLIQKEMKENKSDHTKLMEIQKRAMDVNLKYMRHSMRSTLFSILPLLLVFGWMNSVLLFDSINVGDEFTVTALFDKDASGEAEVTSHEGLELLSDAKQAINANSAQWKFKAETEGTYIVEVTYSGNIFSHEAIVTDERVPKEQMKSFKGQELKALRIDYPKLTVLNIGLKLGWIWTYILISILLSGPARKLLKVY